MRHLEQDSFRKGVQRRRRRSLSRAYPLANGRWLVAMLFAAVLWPAQAHASMFKGEALDKLADILTWVVLVVAPVVGIGVFLLIHILPEKIAEKKQHPQAKAIQCLCLLSLVFGGLLWPLAWLWAYTKPVLYKAAYGTDKVAPEHGGGAAEAKEAEVEVRPARQNIAAVESQPGADSTNKAEKA